MSAIPRAHARPRLMSRRFTVILDTPVFFDTPVFLDMQFCLTLCSARHSAGWRGQQTDSGWRHGIPYDHAGVYVAATTPGARTAYKKRPFVDRWGAHAGAARSRDARRAEPTAAYNGDRSGVSILHALGGRDPRWRATPPLSGIETRIFYVARSRPCRRRDAAFSGSVQRHGEPLRPFAPERDATSRRRMARGVAPDRRGASGRARRARRSRT